MVLKQSTKIFIAFFLLSVGMAQAIDPVSSDTEDFESFQQDPQLLDRAQKQLKELDFALEELAQAVHSGAAKVSDKKSAREQIRTLRELIDRNLDTKTKSFGSRAQRLVELDKALLARTNHLVLKKFQEVEPFDEEQATHSVRSILPVNEAILEAELNDCQVQLDALRTYVKHAGITSINRAARSAEQILDKEWNAISAAKRILPYLALGTYYIFTTRDDDLPKWKWIQDLKAVIGGPTTPAKGLEAVDANAKKDGNTTDKAPENTTDKALPKDTAKGTDKAPENTSDKALPQDTTKSADKAPENTSDKALPQDTTKNADKAPKEDTAKSKPEEKKEHPTISNATGFEEKTKIKNPGGLGGEALARFYTFLTFDKDGKGLINVAPKPIIDLSVGVLFGNRIKDDVTELLKWCSKQTRRGLAYLKGESFDDGSRAKEAKVAFKDIIGNNHAKAQLEKIVNYFKDKESLDRSGALIGRGYLLVGALDTAKCLAQATAKEISERFKEQGKDTVCKVYEVHASELVNDRPKSAEKGDKEASKELGDILKDAEKSAPCIVIVDELDWLCKQEVLFAETWGKLVGTINSIAKSKKEVFVIATAQDRSAIDKILGSAERLGTVITCELPSFEDRQTFFEKELGDRCINRTHFSLDAFAQETQGCKFAQLDTVIKRALNRAYTAHETLKPVHIEQSINEVVHGIRTQDQVHDTEKKILAAHYAGKALTHLLLAPQTRLAKVTILPVETKNGIQQGALITYKDAASSMYATEKEIEKACLIELAGAEAQQILTGSQAPALARGAKKQAMTELKAILFEGLDEKAFSKELREKKKALAESRIEHLKEKAAALLTEHQDLLKLIADTLESKLILNAQEIQELLG